MLYMIGPLALTVHGLNAEGASRKRKMDFAEKGVLGRRKPLENVGEGDDSLELTGAVLPYRLGGVGELALLEMLRASAQPQLVLRGDGALLGWYVIEEVSEKHSYLSAQGLGQKIEVSINLKRDEAPSASDFMGAFASLFG